jgi:malonyl-CoA O-methyltransferase
MKNDGKDGLAVDQIWLKLYGKMIPKSSHLYVLQPLRKAAELLQEPKYLSATENCIEHYLNDKNSLQMSTLTHFLAYELEALIDLGKTKQVLPLLERLRELQDDDGGVRAMDGASWICTPGLAQLAGCWYKVGETEPADRAMEWLERHQMKSGGFLGSYGQQASYFQKAELPWASKFYLDANLLRDRSNSRNLEGR